MNNNKKSILLLVIHYLHIIHLITHKSNKKLNEKLFLRPKKHAIKINYEKKKTIPLTNKEKQ